MFIYNKISANQETQELILECRYYIDYDEEEQKIIVNGRSMKVVYDDVFTYKLLKTRIRAIDGAEGLYNFLKRITDFAECWLCNVCEHVIKYGKETGKEFC